MECDEVLAVRIEGGRLRLKLPSLMTQRGDQSGVKGLPSLHFS